MWGAHFEQRVPKIFFLSKSKNWLLIYQYPIFWDVSAAVLSKLDALTRILTKIELKKSPKGSFSVMMSTCFSIFFWTISDPGAKKYPFNESTEGNTLFLRTILHMLKQSRTDNGKTHLV